MACWGSCLAVLGWSVRHPRRGLGGPPLYTVGANVPLHHQWTQCTEVCRALLASKDVVAVMTLQQK